MKIKSIIAFIAVNLVLGLAPDSSATSPKDLIEQIRIGMTREEAEEALGDDWEKGMMGSFNSLEFVEYQNMSIGDIRIRIDYRWSEWRVIAVPADAPDQIFPGMGIEIIGPLTVVSDPIIILSRKEQNKSP